MNLDYRIEHIDHNSGQEDMELGLYNADTDDILGYVSYTLYDGELSVKNILVHPDHRRKGLGSRMMQYLKRYHSDHKYVPSMKSELGDKFKHKEVGGDLRKYNEMKMSKRKYILTLEGFKNKKINESKEATDKAIKALQATHSVLLSDYPNEEYFDTHILFNEGDKKLMYVSVNEGSGIESMEVQTESFVIFCGSDAYHVSMDPEYIAKDISSSKSSIIIQKEGFNDVYTKIEEFNDKFDEFLEGGNPTAEDIQNMCSYIETVLDEYSNESEMVDYGDQIPEIDKK